MLRDHPYMEFSPWFAWYRVPVTDTKTAWLCWVERRQWQVEYRRRNWFDGHFDRETEWRWIYRQWARDDEASKRGVAG